MNVRRWLVLASLLAAVAGPTSAAAQSVRGTAGPWAPPRTADGHPDLQGNWTNSTLTQLERPPGFELVVSGEDLSRLASLRLEQAARALDAGTGTYDHVFVQPGEGLAVVNGEYRSSLLTFPADGRVPPLTAEAQQRLAAQRAFRSQFGPSDHPENRPPGDRCLTSFGSNAGPPMLPNGFYNDNYTIVQNADHFLILTEMIHDARIVRLGERQPLPAHIRPWFGDSWGRWEGDTLVVQTTNFHPLQQLRGVPSDHLTVIERFHLEDANTILYQFRVEDDTSYSEPWGGEVPMVRFDDQLYEYACHEGNYALYGILSGARAEERRQAEERNNDSPDRP